MAGDLHRSRNIVGDQHELIVNIEIHMDKYQDPEHLSFSICNFRFVIEEMQFNQ
jgi:hypothetical protein